MATMKRLSKSIRVYREWSIATKPNEYFTGVHYIAMKDDGPGTFRREKLADVRRVIDLYEDSGTFDPDVGRPAPGDYDAMVRGADVKRAYKGWQIQKRAGTVGPRRGYSTWYEAKKDGETLTNHKLKILREIIDQIEGTKKMPVKKKRKATPAQLRALKKAHAALRKKRALKKKAPKRPRRNPAYGNYQKARSVARGNTRGVNPVRSTYWVIRVPTRYKNHGGNHYNGADLYGGVRSAVLFQSQKEAQKVAQKLSDKTGFVLEVRRRGE